MFHFSKLTSALAAAVLMVGISTGVVSASTIAPGAVSIIGDDAYDYQGVFAKGSGAATLTFSLKALGGLTLDGGATTLEVTGAFKKLVVTLDSVAATFLGNTLDIHGHIIGRSYGFATTLFASGDIKDLVLSWTDVINGPHPSKSGTVAQINLQLYTSAVPVPAAGLMLVSALGGIGALRRRARKA